MQDRRKNRLEPVPGTSCTQKHRLHLLYLQPTGPETVPPIIDEATRRMAAALFAATPREETMLGWHECVCGAISAGEVVLPGGVLTHRLAVDYLAHHRAEVPAAGIERVLALGCGEAEPTEPMLRGGRMSLEPVELPLPVLPLSPASTCTG